MPSRSVLVTYTLHPTPPPQHVNQAQSPSLRALEGIRAQLPLTNLHWKPTSRTSLRTIQSVDVDVKELGEVGTLGKELGGSVLDWPLVNLCLVTCESDEVYKYQTKSFIRDWLSLLAARRTVHAPLIVLVNNASAAASSGKNVFGRDKGMIAKLRTDFNTGKRDRCVQVNLPADGKDDPAVWVEVINKLKESIVSALDGAVLEREEDVKRSEAQRMTVGWNFCAWFLLKESLAHSFEGVNLHEDALVVYEELEAAFLQILKEQNLAWFGKLGATGVRDDSLPVLDTTCKPYRHLFQTSSISIFDFRVYVFARQAQLLGKLGRVTEVAKRGQWFIASLSRRLRENEADLAEYFIESWTYTACLDIIAKCDEWSRLDRPNGDYSGLIAYDSARSELLDIARVQVERIGVAVGHLPNEYPFAPSSALVIASDDVLFASSDNGLSDGEDNEEPVARASISSAQLLDAMADPANFRALYATLTKRAISAYEACRKLNSIVRLHADLAALALLQEDWRNAYQLCRELASDCAEQSVWETASIFALSGAIRSHRHLVLPLDEDWITLALAYLRAAVITGAKHGDRSAEVQEVLEAVRGAGVDPLVVEGHPILSVRAVGDRASFGSPPGVISMQCKVQNHLDADFAFDKVEICLSSSIIGEVVFASDKLSLSPGAHSVRAITSTSAQGVFDVIEYRIHLGHIVFSYSASESGPERLSIPANPAGLQASLQTPKNIALDQDPAVVLEVMANGCDMSDVRISLVSMEDDVQWHLESASSSDGALTTSADEVGLDRLPPHGQISLTIPYITQSQLDEATARVTIAYRTSGGEARTYIGTQTVSLGLPLAVNVQDFFRPQCLISHFTIASDGKEHLRIGSVTLNPGKEASYVVEPARKDWTSTTVISPSQPLSCLFKVKQKPSSPDLLGAVLRLVIEYQHLSSDVRAPSLLAEAEDESARHWRSLEIPVELPQKRLLITARFDRSPMSNAVYEGRALAMQVFLSTSFAWSGSVQQKTVPLVWDITASQDDWIVLGQKKGFFTAEVDGPAVQQEVVLVPVRAGKLFLPSVHVNLFTESGDHGTGVSPDLEGLICETYVANAAEAITVLPAKISRTVLVPV